MDNPRIAIILPYYFTFRTIRT